MADKETKTEVDGKATESVATEPSPELSIGIQHVEPSIPFKEYASREGRYRLLAHARPEDADRLMDEAQAEVDRKWQLYKDMSRQGVEVVASDLAGGTTDGTPFVSRDA